MRFHAAALALAVLATPTLHARRPAPGTVEVVRTFRSRQPTGVAVSRAGRVFVSFPRWTDGVHSLSVAEVLPSGKLRPYPDATWNRWDGADLDMAEHRLVCAQSVVVDSSDTLWILDSASPNFSGTLPGAAKLLKVDLETDRVIEVFHLPHAVARTDSYMNDVRVDVRTGHAYLTDSGRPGLAVVELSTGQSWRVLDDHATTSADPRLRPVIGGRIWRTADGSIPRIHSDGIALDPDQGWLYWHALTGRRLYRLPTRLLRNPGAVDRLEDAVEDLGETVVTDGMLLGPLGEVIHTSLERDALHAWSEAAGLELLVRDPLLAWPDSLAWGPGRWLYVTTSRIHEMPRFWPEGPAKREPFRLLRVYLGD